MAAPTFDSTKHHVGLKERGTATNYGFLISGAYRMEMQREGHGAPDFGGQTDLIGSVPAQARWTQDDFTGGAFQWRWGRDDAMFADCTNFMPDPQGRSLISVPPMFQKKALDPDAQSNWTSDTPLSMFLVGASIYICWSHTLARYRIDTDALTYVAPSTNCVFVGAQYDPNDGLIWAVQNSSVTDDVATVRRIKLDLTAPTVDALYNFPSATANHKCKGFTIYDSNIVAQVDRVLYIGTPPDRVDPAIAGTITWTRIGRLPGRWKDAQLYNGLIYILLNDGTSSPTYGSTLVAFDGTDVLPVARFPHSFYAKVMEEYGGRVFVGGTGTDVNGGEAYAELYEVTGASIRLVRTFSPETRNAFLGGAAGEWPNSIDAMAVHEGLLWFAQRGKRMMVYDLTSDGFFGASEIQSNANLSFPALTSGRGRLWGFGLDTGADSGHGIYRIAQPADTISTWNPTLVTSDLAFEPAMKKRWGQITVMTRYGGLDSIEYSTDCGQTWTSLTISATTRNKVNITTASLAAVAPTENIRFRIKCDTGDSDAVTYHRELVAFSVSFAMLDVGKRAWSFTIANVEEAETLDAELSEGTVQAQDTGDIKALIEGYATAQTPLTFTDVDRSTYDVTLVGLTRSLPNVATIPSGETMPECLYSITLLEA